MFSKLLGIIYSCKNMALQKLCHSPLGPKMFSSDNVIWREQQLHSSQTCLQYNTALGEAYWHQCSKRKGWKWSDHYNEKCEADDMQFCLNNWILITENCAACPFLFSSSLEVAFPQQWIIPGLWHKATCGPKVCRELGPDGAKDLWYTTVLWKPLVPQQLLQLI